MIIFSGFHRGIINHIKIYVNTIIKVLSIERPYVNLYFALLSVTLNSKRKTIKRSIICSDHYCYQIC